MPANHNVPHTPESRAKISAALLVIALLANGRLEIVRRGGEIQERKWLRLGGNWIEPVEWQDGVPVLSERVRALFEERLKAVEEFFA